jgi:hypothetical protein
VDCVDVDRPGPVTSPGENSCSWELIIQALRNKLAEVPADERPQFENFIGLLEGIAALSE